MPDAKATFALVGDDQTAAAFKSALGSTQVFAKQANDLLKGAFELGGVSFAASFIKDMADLGRSLEDGAQRAGLAQGDFNQLAAAFDEAGVSADSLSKGIKNMQVAISSANNGNDTIAAAFNEIGLSAASLKALAPDVQLLAIAEAISRIPDPADRARLGAQLLGKQFLEIEPMLLKGAAGLDAVVKAAHGLDPEDTQSLADASKFIGQMGSNLKMLGADLVGGAGNVLTSMWGTFKDAVNPLGLINKELQEMHGNLNSLPATGNVLAALSEQGKGQIEAAGQAILKSNLDAITAEEDMDRKAAADREALLDQEFKDTQTRGEKRVDFEAKVDDLITAHRISAYEGFKRIYAQDQAASNQTADALAKSVNSGAIDAAWQDTQKQWQENTDALAAKSKAAGDAMREDFQKTQQNAKTAAEGIEDAFTEFVVDPFEGGAKKMLSTWITMLAQMEARAATAQLDKALFGTGGLAGAFASFLGGGSSTSVTYDASPGAASALLDAAAGHASGASWMVGGSGGEDSQLVRFRASPSERVTVSRPGQGTDGGVTLHQTINIDARADAGQIRQLVQQSTAYAINQSVSKVVDMSRRGQFAPR